MCFLELRRADWDQGGFFTFPAPSPETLSADAK